jgi:hypothetical protein
MTIWTNSITNYRSSTRPDRVRLQDGSTRTGEEVTDELLLMSGWTEIPDEIPSEIIHSINSGTNTVETT